MKRHMLYVCLVALGVCVLAVNASAQIPITPDTFKVNYFANNGVAGAPDATVRLDNPGSPFTNPDSRVAADGINGDVTLCALIFVFDNDQQLTECCGCVLTPDGLRTLSVTRDLTSNPLTSVVSNNGVVKIVSTVAVDSCTPVINGAFVIEPTIRAWASHIQNKVGTAYPITETAFTDATLSQNEVLNLAEDCSFAQRLGSGKGVCSCGTGD